MFDDASPASAAPRPPAIRRAGTAEQLQRIEEQIRTLERHAAAAVRPAPAPVAPARRPLAALSPVQLLALGFIAEGAGDYAADDPVPATLSGLGLVECADGAWRLTGLGRSLLRHQG